ncbi:SDR family oxidoreductase [Phyllobacterium sp. TAF24]|uniref:SDR family oxidoreductase n=1 Tax=Phyllobacterium sp. TAF24 TaxID=3233068 RepID=UPI003F97A5EA
MKIVVIGGNGLIGAKLVGRLKDRGHDVIAASPRTGVNAVTGEGLDEALKGANVVIDVSNAPSFEDQAAMEFFQNSARNIAAIEIAEGIHHHIALSVVGTDRLQESGYFRAKLVQETLIKSAGVPYTIVRATQFFEFLDSIISFSFVENAIRLPAAAFQPIAAGDVAAALEEVVLGEPVNGTVEIAGPDRGTLTGIVESYLRATGDTRSIMTDPNAPYFGVSIDELSLVPGQGARLQPTTLQQWLQKSSH